MSLAGFSVNSDAGVGAPIPEALGHNPTGLAPVSVVIPCFRHGEAVARALASVHTQTWRPSEVILIEDQSGDGTLNELQGLIARYPSHWVRILTMPENQGPGSARNLGWDHASQPYVAFLDADDEWHPQKIAIQLGWMLENPEVMLSGHAVIGQENLPRRLLARLTGAREDSGFVRIGPKRLLVSNCFPTPSVMVQRQLSLRFRPGKYRSEDFLLWCEICLDGHPCHRSGLPLARLHARTGGSLGLSEHLWLMETGELDTYFSLWRSSRISFLTCGGLILLSMGKFSLRLADQLLGQRWTRPPRLSQ